MAIKYISSVLIIALGMVLVTTARADRLQTDSHEIVAGIAGGAAAVAVAVTLLAVHYSKKRSITGCIASAGDRMTIADEKDKQIYALSGNTTDIKAGDRMKLAGKKAKHTSSDATPVWEATTVSKDLGVCQF